MKSEDGIIKKARNVILNSFIQENERPGFPEIIGRKRSTEWGGTISALHVLHDMNPTQERNTAIELSIEGIIASQNQSTHAWGAGGVDLIEATSEIVYYLSKDFLTLEKVEESVNCAVDYINSKFYDKGYFHSGAFSEQSEHTLYATYQAVRALVQVNKLSDQQKNSIKDWIKNNHTADGLWGDNNNTNQSSITHSIYALLTLLLLGEKTKDLKEEFKKQISIIFKSIIKDNINYYYEEYSIPTNESDSSGNKFKRIRINHFVLPLAIELFLKIEGFVRARFLIERLKKINYDGAWGLYQTFRTTWATQQAIDALSEYQNCKRTWWDVLFCFILKLRYMYWPIVIIFSLVLVVLFLVFGSEDVIKLLLSFFGGVITGVIANKITG